MSHVVPAGAAMVGKPTAAHRAIDAAVEKEQRAFLASNRGLPSNELKARMAMIRAQHTSGRGGAMSKTILNMTSQELEDIQASKFVVQDQRGSPGVVYKRESWMNSFQCFRIATLSIDELQAYTDCPDPEDLIAFARVAHSSRRKMHKLGLSYRHYMSALNELKLAILTQWPAFGNVWGQGYQLGLIGAVDVLYKTPGILYKGNLWEKHWLQTLHVSFIIRAYLLRAVRVGTNSWTRVVQDVLGIVVMCTTGCRVGELVRTRDMSDETAMTWEDIMVVFDRSRPTIETAQVRFRLRFQKGEKGNLNTERWVVAKDLSLTGVAHMSPVALVLVYARRQGRVSGTIEEISAAAASNSKGEIAWARRAEPFMHAWLDHKGSFPRPNYGVPMSTESYLRRFREVTRTAGFGDQVCHALRRGAAKDAKDVAAASAGGMDPRSVLGHRPSLTDNYALQESNNEYEGRVSHALQQPVPAFDYSGFLGRAFNGEESDVVIARPIGSHALPSTATRPTKVLEFPHGTKWVMLKQAELRRACKERGYAVHGETVGLMKKRLDEHDALHSVDVLPDASLSSTLHLPAESDLSQLQSAFSAIDTDAAVTMTQEEEDDFDDLVYEAAGAPLDIAQYLDNISAFVEHFSVVNDITVVAVGSWVNRSKSTDGPEVLRSKLSAYFGNGMDEPSLWVYDVPSSTRWIWKTSVNQKKPTSPPAVVKSYRHEASKRRPPIVLLKPHPCRFALCGNPIVWAAWGLYCQHLKSHGITGKEAIGYVDGGYEGTSHKIRPSALRAQSKTVDATPNSGVPDTDCESDIVDEDDDTKSDAEDGNPEEDYQPIQQPTRVTQPLSSNHVTPRSDMGHYVSDARGHEMSSPFEYPSPSSAACTDAHAQLEHDDDDDDGEDPIRPIARPRRPFQPSLSIQPTPAEPLVGGGPNQHIIQPSASLEQSSQTPLGEIMGNVPHADRVLKRARPATGPIHVSNGKSLSDSRGGHKKMKTVSSLALASGTVLNSEPVVRSVRPSRSLARVNYTIPPMESFDS